MSAVTSLLEFLRNLLVDEDERKAFNDNPESYLASHGLEDVSGEDVYDAVGLVGDTLPPRAASQLGSFYRNISTGSGPVHTAQAGPIDSPVSQHTLPPPPPVHKQPGETDLDAAIRQITYITNNYATTKIDDRDTVTDNSVNQQIRAHGDVFQDFDNDVVNASGDGSFAVGEDSNVAVGEGAVAAENSQVATGDDNILADDGSVVADDGSVAAGGNITGSQIQTGDGFQVGGHVEDAVFGDRNQVAQDSTGVGFGEGDVHVAKFDDVSIDDGSALSVGGAASGRYEDNDVNVQDFGAGDTNAVINTGDDNKLAVDQSEDNSFKAHDSFNTDNSTTVKDSYDTEDSFNTKDSFNTEDSYDTEDSFNKTVSDDDSYTVKDSYDTEDSFNKVKTVSDDDHVDIHH